MFFKSKSTKCKHFITLKVLHNKILWMKHGMLFTSCTFCYKLYFGKINKLLVFDSMGSAVSRTSLCICIMPRSKGCHFKVLLKNNASYAARAKWKVIFKQLPTHYSKVPSSALQQNPENNFRKYNANVWAQYTIFFSPPHTECTRIIIIFVVCLTLQSRSSSK
jgi:hypothetical protein